MEQTKLKDSEVQWIGKIPEEWTVTKIKYELDFLESGGTPESSNPDFYNDDGINWVSIGDMSTNNYVYETKNKITIDAIRDKNLRIYPQNTVIYSIYATIGKVSELMVPATVNQAILAIKMNNNINQNFFKYQLETMEKEVSSLVSSNTQNNLNAFKVRNFSIVLPNIKEQQKIAKFLDEKCGNIDEIIKETEEQIEILEKYKKSLITEVVTKGLNSTAPMKDSGIEWIGQIPAHWEVNKLRFCTQVRNEKGLFINGSIYIGLENIESKSAKYLQSDSVYEEIIYDKFKKGDLLVNKLRPYLAKTYLAEMDGYCTGELIVYKQFDGIIKYLFYYTFSNGYLELVNASTYGTKMPRASWDFIKNMIIPIPSRTEQQEIVEYLDKKCAVIDETLEDKKQAIETLKQYKNSLIYEYVTGKKRV